MQIVQKSQGCNPFWTQTDEMKINKFGSTPSLARPTTLSNPKEIWNYVGKKNKKETILVSFMGCLEVP